MGCFDKGVFEEELEGGLKWDDNLVFGMIVLLNLYGGFGLGVDEVWRGDLTLRNMSIIVCVLYWNFI